MKGIYKLFPMLKGDTKATRQLGELSSSEAMRTTHNFLFVKASQNLLGFPSI